MLTHLPAQDIQAHTRALYAYALRKVSDPELARDLVQDTLVAALDGAPSYRGESGLRTWLIGILKHKILDEYRARKYAPSRLDDVEEHALEAGSAKPDEALQQKRFWETFERQLAALPERSARALVLSVLGGLDTDEISRLLNVSRANLWVMLHRARRSLDKPLSAAMSS
jgi:RNA polymerase sigma-70 factor (ECF subfamily)